MRSFDAIPSDFGSDFGAVELSDGVVVSSYGIFDPQDAERSSDVYGDTSVASVAELARPALSALPALPARMSATEPTTPVRLVPGLAVVEERSETDPAETLICQLGEYDVVGEIARGGMGGVFLARDPRDGQRYALKVLEPQFAIHPAIVARLRDELEVSRRARHDGLLEIHAFDRTEEGVPYLVMEYLDGETLGTLLERGRFELGAIAAIGAQIAAAVAALHAAGVVHCDLKPDNIHVLYEEGLAGWPATKVLDFGVARLLDAVVEDEPTIAGTPAYMAPEQWRGEAVTGSDVYALGCVLYELCTGEAPFTGTLAELMSAHLESLPMRAAVRRPSMRPDLDRLISRMLAKDPALRPRMAEVARALNGLAVASPSTVQDGSTTVWALLAAG